jgi:hypothetical protein
MILGRLLMVKKESTHWQMCWKRREWCHANLPADVSTIASFILQFFNSSILQLVVVLSRSLRQYTTRAHLFGLIRYGKCVCYYCNVAGENYHFEFEQINSMINYQRWIGLNSKEFNPLNYVVKNSISDSSVPKKFS